VRTTFSALAILMLANPALAQGFGCPTDVNQQLYEMTEQARDGTLTPVEVGEKATEIIRGCGGSRTIFAQFLELFTVAGLSVEPPDGVRFGAHVNAIRTIGRLEQLKGQALTPIRLTDAEGNRFEWTTIEERNAYWDLMFAISSDFLVYGVHADIYTPGKLERFGCGLYPAEEASALATHGDRNVDGGELVARVAYLGRECDTPARETSGYVARYFAGHYRARLATDGYVGLTASDIRAGLQTFLAKHLDGAPESDLFTMEETTELLEF